jgi:tetratricopeptide (TPR) repeat protein/transcriptional regulator with XRE-family HTH domain
MIGRRGDRESLGSWLRWQREALGLTQEELAERSGLSVRTVSNLECDRTQKPYPRSVRRITGALGLDEVARSELIARCRPGRDAHSGLTQQAGGDVPGSLTTLDLEWGQAGSALRFVPRQLPAAVADFVGRAAELKILDGLLEQVSGSGDWAGRAVIISAIGGTAGVGKTALAVHWAQQVADRFPDGQLYANLRGFDPEGTPAAPGEVIRAFLNALQVPAERIPPGLAAQAGLYRSLLAGRQMLIVLDNARDAAQTRPLLPGAPGSLVVVTSRSQLAGLAATEGARLITLNMLTGDEAAELLSGRLGLDRISAELEAAGELADLCDGLPLALSITAARAAARPRFPLAALAAGLRDEHSRLDALDAGEETASVRAAFSWSFQSLADSAAELFRLLGLHPGPDISVPAAASLAGLDVAHARRTLGQLAGACLISEHVPGRYAFHDLLRAYAAEQAHAPGSGTAPRAAIRRILDHCLQTGVAADRQLNPQRDPITLGPPEPGTTPEGVADYRQAMAWFEAEHRVLLAAVTLAARHGLDAYAWQLPWALGSFLDWRGHWHDWVAVQRTAVAAAQRLGDNAAQAQSLRGLGHAYGLLGSYQKAYDQFKQALDLYSRLGDRIGQARMYHELAWSYGIRGRYQEALEHSQQTLRLSRASGHRAGEAIALNGVGWDSAHLGNYQHAITSCYQALDLYRDLGDRHGQAVVWDSLGYAHFHSGAHAKAVICYQQAVSLFREVGSRYYEAQALASLGDSCYAARQPRAARDARQQALAIFQDLRHPHAVQVRAALRRPGTTIHFDR